MGGKYYFSLFPFFLRHHLHFPPCSSVWSKLGIFRVIHSQIGLQGKTRSSDKALLPQVQLHETQNLMLRSSLIQSGLRGGDWTSHAPPSLHVPSGAERCRRHIGEKMEVLWIWGIRIRDDKATSYLTPTNWQLDMWPEVVKPKPNEEKHWPYPPIRNLEALLTWTSSILSRLKSLFFGNLWKHLQFEHGQTLFSWTHLGLVFLTFENGGKSDKGDFEPLTCCFFCPEASERLICFYYLWFNSVNSRFCFFN